MNYKIAERAASLSPWLTLAISAKAKILKAAGEDGFGAGEPDFDTPQSTTNRVVKEYVQNYYSTN